MNFYNGYSPHQRMKAYKWLMNQYEKGLRTKPNKCDSCALDVGIIEPHSENYSEPYGEHIGQYGFCYRCHMMLHCRKRNSKNFLAYCQAVNEGKQYEPFYKRDWSKFKKEMLVTFSPKIYKKYELTSNILEKLNGN